MSEIRFVVFDCDGTLVDSQHSIVSAAHEAWTRHDLEPPPAEQVRRVVGLHLGEALLQLLPDQHHHLLPGLIDAYKNSVAKSRAAGANRDPLYEGAFEEVVRLAEAGVLLGVATGKSRRGLLATLEGHGLLDRFAVLKTADDGPGKPHPHILLDAMEKVGADSAETAMVGDTTFDIKMARNAKVHAIGVTWGYHDGEELTEAGAHVLVDRFQDLSAAIEGAAG